jgi:hypothetical protein
MNEELAMKEIKEVALPDVFPFRWERISSTIVCRQELQIPEVAASPVATLEEVIGSDILLVAFTLESLPFKEQAAMALGLSKETLRTDYEVEEDEIDEIFRVLSPSPEDMANVMLRPGSIEELQGLLNHVLQRLYSHVPELHAIVAQLLTDPLTINAPSAEENEIQQSPILVFWMPEEVLSQLVSALIDPSRFLNKM